MKFVLERCLTAMLVLNEWEQPMKNVSGLTIAVMMLHLSCGDQQIAPDVLDAAADTVADVPVATDAFDDVVQPAPPDLAVHVNQFIGTSGSGNVFVGASVPRGMVKLGPNTDVREGAITGYKYEDDRIKGFVHSHLEGPGGSGNGYNRILVIPVTGEPGTSESEYASAFTHSSETAEPGYYSVLLDSYGILAELTATRLVGLHRYTYPAAERAAVLIDLRTSLGQWLDSSLEVIGNDTVEGWSRYQTNPLVAMFADLVDPGTGVSTVYFSARMDRAFDSAEVWGESPEAGAALVFATGQDDVVELRVGISYISVEQARVNREEVAGMTFEQVRDEARLKWNRLLSRVEVDSDNAEYLTRFYTALYHSLLAPADYTEGNGFFSGADGVGQTVQADGWRYYTDDWCMWDTYRTSHPLFSIIEPEVNSDMLQSLVHTFEAGGWMQKCTWNAVGDSRVMTANPQFCVIADGFMKGYRNFDVATAWEAMKKGSMEDSENPMPDGMCGYFNRGTPPEYVENGYVSMDCDIDQSASMTLEHAHDDWCVARVARELGLDEDAEYFEDRSLNYVNHWNAEEGFMVPRNRDGTWIDGFEPENKAGFCEADSWKYTWSVPHDICGLVALMGGPEAFAAKLDRFFDEDHFAMDNQPDFHAPWLYNFAGQASKTQSRVAELLAVHFGAGPGGLPGNDDAGSMSAWSIFASLGFYPVTPGGDLYQINTPLFSRAVIHIDPARKDGIDFEIQADGLNPANRYIQSAEYNGAALEVPWITHRQIMDGGLLRLVMGPEPSSWGISPCSD